MLLMVPLIGSLDINKYGARQLYSAVRLEGVFGWGVNPSTLHVEFSSKHVIIIEVKEHKEFCQQ